MTAASLRAHRLTLRIKIKGRLVAPVPEERHGRQVTYAQWGCRCGRCNEANNAHGRRTRKAREDRRIIRDGRWYAPDASTHGDYSTYVNWGCRCDPCTDANRDRAQAKRRAA